MNDFRAGLYLCLWGRRPVTMSNSADGPACPLDPTMTQARAVAEEILDSIEEMEPHELKRAVVQAAYGKLLLCIVSEQTSPQDLVDCVKAVKALSGAGGLKRVPRFRAGVVSPEMLSSIDELLEKVGGR